MVVCADFMCMAQTAFASQRFDQDSAAYVWMVFCVLLSFVVGLLLLARSRYPHATFVAACVAVLVFPYDSTIALMALTALLARRNDTRTTVRAIAAGGFVTLVAQVRDTLRPPEASIWHMVFAKPDTGSQYGTDLVMLADERTIVVTAVVAALLELAIATLAGLHIRSRALASLATAKADAADAQVAQLKTAIDSQQLAEQTGRIAEKTEEIRKQAAGALDEAHSVIDMLRHPEQAREQLAPSDETSLTRESLDALIGDARAAGMRLNTWIDIQQLGQLNRETGKIAYRSLQEGLTNASRHAPGSPVSLELTANPTAGVHAHVSNPTIPANGTHLDTNAKDMSRTGAGLPGLAERVRQSGGTCRFGFDPQHTFHMDVQLPWVE
ncbi:sensor histidine kinase [Bifidobacterium adolescentis]|uniref:sensor histidine kinase n=1 Tax=Bifidobacterium adolescentis TaxID=1680 RepID=UPI002A59FAD2|nr:sensor histidine kinase [Bifidobacterium adolescentis]